MAKAYWICCVEILQKIPEIFHHHKSIIISLHKPVSIIPMVVKHIFKSLRIFRYHGPLSPRPLTCLVLPHSCCLPSLMFRATAPRSVSALELMNTSLSQCLPQVFFTWIACTESKCCHSPTQPQPELELDLIMGRNPPPTTHQELLRNL
jgi:hypothetical protein